MAPDFPSVTMQRSPWKRVACCPADKDEVRPSGCLRSAAKPGLLGGEGLSLSRPRVWAWGLCASQAPTLVSGNRACRVSE